MLRHDRRVEDVGRISDAVVRLDHVPVKHLHAMPASMATVVGPLVSLHRSSCTLCASPWRFQEGVAERACDASSREVHKPSNALPCRCVGLWARHPCSWRGLAP